MIAVNAHRQHLIPILATLLIASFGLCHQANAEGSEALWRQANYDLRSVAHRLIQHQTVRQITTPGNYYNAKTSALSGLNWGAYEPEFVKFARECAEIDAIPFVEISSSSTKRVFLGVNFDGVLGFHGQLL